MATTDDSRPLVPYGSARDLPTYREMAEQIRGAKVLTRFVARDQRANVLKVEEQLNHLADVVDRFYECLGGRHWVFHDTLSVSAVEGILDTTSTPADAELAFIELYRDRENTSFWIGRLRAVDGLRERFHQIERAREHYDAEQYDSAVLQLIAVMDGFVNDFEPSRRRGLASREPDEMTAWDSVAGHHMGLTNALKAFTRTFKKRVDEEVFELHRHGIMHGMIPRFDNVVVATKAWNMLFALTDWAKATTKSREPKKPEPGLRDTFRQMVRTSQVNAKVAAWQPQTLGPANPEFNSHGLYTHTTSFFEAWRSRNFGALAEFPTRQFLDRGRSTPEIAGRLRKQFDGFDLSEYEITELENSAPAIWLARGTATVNGNAGTFECRWLVEEPDGTFGFGSDSAVWRLAFCEPWIWKAGSV